MEIAAFDTDDLADDSGKAPITWIGKELLATVRRFNPALVTNADGTYKESTGGVGGWEKSELRSYLKNTVKPLIPLVVIEAIVETKGNRAHTIHLVTILHKLRVMTYGYRAEERFGVCSVHMKNF